MMKPPKTSQNFRPKNETISNSIKTNTVTKLIVNKMTTSKFSNY